MIEPSTDFLTALGETSIRPCWLLDIGDLKWTTNSRDITIGTETWQAVAGITKMPAIKRQRELKAHSVSLEISALDPFFRDLFLSPSVTWVGQLITIHLCLLSTAGDPISAEKVTQYQGLFDQVTLDGDRIILTVQSPFAKPSQTAGRLITNQSQRDFSAGDRFMEYAHMTFENLAWGGE